MIIATIAIILLLPLLALYWERGNLTPLVITTSFLAPVLIGYVELDPTNESQMAPLYCAAVVSLALGHFAHHVFQRTWRPIPRAPAASPGLPRHSSPGLGLFVSVVVALTFYHFLSSGIPLLSDDVETARFDFTSSGMFGIPGRMFLFGLPFAVFLVSLSATRRLTRVSRKLTYLVWTSYASASLLGGFKGGLVSVLTTMLLVRSASGTPLSLKRVLVGWRVAVIVGAMAYCALISFRYRSLGLTNPGDVLQYLASRATVSAAAPGYLVFNRCGTGGSGGEQFAQDLGYFLHKYLPFLPLDQDDLILPFDKTVSAALYHTPISKSAFIVPVTIGAFPELVANVGVTGGILGMFFVGALLSYLVTGAQTCKPACKSGLFALAVHLLQIYVLNGNFVYTCLNFALVSVLLFLLYRACRMVSLMFQNLEFWELNGTRELVHTGRR